MNGRIAFVDLEGRVTTAAPDGGARRTLTGSPRIFQFPSWSHDGRYVAAIGRNENGGGLYVFADGDSAPFVEPERFLSHHAPPFYHAWSPHAHTLLFLTPHEGQTYALRGGPLTSAPQLLATGHPFFWSWTARPDQLLIHSGGPEQGARLALFDAAQGLWGKNLIQPGRFQTPGVSADGRFRAFAGMNLDGGSRLIVERLRSGERLHLPHFGLIRFVWSPAAAALAFISPPHDEMAYGPLLLLNAETGTAQQLTKEPVVAFFWSPDGRFLAILTLADDGQAAGRQNGAYTNGHTQQTGVAAGSTYAPALHLSVMDLAAHHTHALLTFTPPPTFVHHFLPFFDQYAQSHRLWSPDSEALVFPVLRADSAEILRIPINGRSPQVVAEGLMPCWRPAL